MEQWNKLIDIQDGQFILIQKMFEKNGLQIIMTCPACPEQYDVFKDGEQVAYLRLRHGVFRVDYPTCNDENIYKAEPSGDGIFDDNERTKYMTIAMNKVLDKLNQR